MFLPAGLAGPCPATVLSVDCQLFLTSKEQEEVHILTGSGTEAGAMSLALCVGQGLPVLHTHVSQPMLWIRSLTPYLTAPCLTLAWLCP